MNLIALAVLIDSVVVTTVGFHLKRTAKREAENASIAFRKALEEAGPEIMAQAIAKIMEPKEQ